MFAYTMQGVNTGLDHELKRGLRGVECTQYLLGLGIVAFKTGLMVV
jgi:hypothetical protein